MSLLPPVNPPLEPPDKPAGVRPAGSSAAGRWASVMPLIAAALLGMLVFGISVRADYIYDDVFIALEDGRLTDPSLWGLYWTKDYNYDVKVGDGAIDNLYRPLVSMTYAVQVWFHGPGNPAPLHAVNVLLYGLCCAVVARLGRVLGGERVAWTAGLLFAAHPVHAEAVCSIVGRAELMAMLGLVGAVTLHLGGPPSYRRTAGIVACGVVGLLSKEQGLLLPAILLAAEPLRRMRLARPVLPVRSVGGEIDGGPVLDYATPASRGRGGVSPLQAMVLSVCLMTGAYIVLRESVLGLKFWWERSFLDAAVQPMIWSQGADRWLMPFVLLGRYLGQLLMPVHLSFDYSGPAIGWRVSASDPYLYLGMVAATAGVTSLAVCLYLRRWAAVFVLVSLALTYGVVSNSVSLIGVIYAERLVFTPSVFFVVLLAWALVRLPRGVWVGALSLLVTAGGVHSAVYASRWDDRLSFYLYTLETNPRSIRAHQVTSELLMRRGDLDRSAEIAEAGTRVMPEYDAIWTQAALVAEKRGKWDDAERYLITAARINPRVGPLLGKLRERMAATRATTLPAPR